MTTEAAERAAGLLRALGQLQVHEKSAWMLRGLLD